MFKITTASALVAVSLAACSTTMNFQASPSQWNEETYTHFLRQGRSVQCAILQNSSTKSVAPDDQSFISSELKRLGNNKRDIEILMNPTKIYGTGMSYRGLECAAKGSLSRNTSFYSGVGHQWQVPFGSGFVYLRGDGTEKGMKVYAWN